MASWKESLKIGEDFEKFVIQEIKTKLAVSATKNEVAANLKLYDITLENTKTIECKCDERAEETRNICIETHCSAVIGHSKQKSVPKNRSGRVRTAALHVFCPHNSIFALGEL